MFGLFTAAPHTDARLGTFRRSWGAWRGAIILDGAHAVPLIVAGSRAAPDPKALDVAQSLPAAFAKLRPAIAEKLFEHCDPYLEAVRGGEYAEPENRDILRIASAADTWAFVEPTAVSVKAVAGEYTAELALKAAWDEEHTLGVTIAGDRLVEFNGSIGPM